MTLYRPDAFEPLTDTSWSEDRAREGIREIVADAEAALRGRTLFWQANAWDGWHGTSPMKNLYVGTAGVLWALDRLQRAGDAETTLELADLAARNVELFRDRPDFMKGMKLPTPRAAFSTATLSCPERWPRKITIPPSTSCRVSVACLRRCRRLNICPPRRSCAMRCLPINKRVT